VLDAFGAAGFAGTGGVTFGVRRRRRGDLENLLVELTQLAIVLAPAPGPSATNTCGICWLRAATWRSSPATSCF